MHFFLQDTYKV